MSTFNPSSFGSMYAGSTTFSVARASTTGTLRNNPAYLLVNLDVPNYYVEHAYFVFDTSSIADGAVVVSATITVTARSGTSTGVRHWAFYDSNGADTVEANDFDNFGTTQLSNSILRQDFATTGNPQVWTLNSAGCSAINKTGLTKFCCREIDKDIGNVAPTDNSTWGFDTPVLTVVLAVAPTVTTQAVSEIKYTTAIGNGDVTADGGATITERGVCIGASANPTTADTKFTTTGTTGLFTVSMTSLTKNTHYHARAYAINSIGTSYGADVEFDTLYLPNELRDFTNKPGAVYDANKTTVIYAEDLALIKEWIEYLNSKI